MVSNLDEEESLYASPLDVAQRKEDKNSNDDWQEANSSNIAPSFELSEEDERRDEWSHIGQLNRGADLSDGDIDSDTEIDRISDTDGSKNKNSNENNNNNKNSSNNKNNNNNRNQNDHDDDDKSIKMKDNSTVRGRINKSKGNKDDEKKYELADKLSLYR